MPLEVLCHIKYINTLLSQTEARSWMTVTFCAVPSPELWFCLPALLFSLLVFQAPVLITNPGLLAALKQPYIYHLSPLHYMSLKPKKRAQQALLNETIPHGLTTDQQPLLCFRDQVKLTQVKTPKYSPITFYYFKLVSKLEKLVSAPRYC